MNMAARAANPEHLPTCDDVRPPPGSSGAPSRSSLAQRSRSEPARASGAGAGVGGFAAAPAPRTRTGRGGSGSPAGRGGSGDAAGRGGGGDAGGGGVGGAAAGAPRVALGSDAVGMKLISSTSGATPRPSASAGMAGRGAGAAAAGPACAPTAARAAGGGCPRRPSSSRQPRPRAAAGAARSRGGAASTPGPSAAAPPSGGARGRRTRARADAPCAAARSRASRCGRVGAGGRRGPPVASRSSTSFGSLRAPALVVNEVLQTPAWIRAGQMLVAAHPTTRSWHRDCMVSHARCRAPVRAKRRAPRRLTRVARTTCAQRCLDSWSEASMAYDRVWQGNLGPVQAGAPVHVARVRELLPADLPAAPAHDGPARSAVRLNSNPKPTLTQPCATQRRWPACWQGGVQSRPPACGSGRQLFHQAETDTRTGPQMWPPPPDSALHAGGSGRALAGTSAPRPAAGRVGAQHWPAWAPGARRGRTSAWRSGPARAR